MEMINKLMINIGVFPKFLSRYNKKQRNNEIKKFIIAKLLRFLKITKPIELDKYEIQWIKLFKGHYKEKYPTTGSWINTIKPLFVEIYGWNPDEDNNYQDYLSCMFNRLLELYLKIQDDKSGSNVQLKDVFYASFVKNYKYEEESSIERAIARLCGLIQCNTVIENGVERYSLEEN